MNLSICTPWKPVKLYEVKTMNEGDEKRIENRLRYHWPIWFAEDFNETLSQGQLVDISSSGAAFTYQDEGNCPYLGQEVTARFSVPRFNAEDSFDMASYTRAVRVCRVDQINSFIRRIAVQFIEPLPFRPGEQSDSEADTRKRLKSVTI
ncbi:MAG: PilZ domain-containing protein [Planctomycetes bacterium]|nr:PilZ domain-containing protein [Planctomycetota bacterium]